MSSTFEGTLQALFSESTSVWSYFPLTPTLDTANWQPIAWQYQFLSATSNDLRVIPTVQFSHDALTWGDEVELTGAGVFPSDEWTYGDEFTGISAAGQTSRRYVRFGMKVKKNASAVLEFARARMIVIGRN